MKKIKTYLNKFILVDDEDFERLSRYTWSLHKAENEVYYARNKKIGQIARFILNAPKSKQVDHINRNGLDNRKCNLRLCTQKQNLRNSKLRKNNLLFMKGVQKNEGVNSKHGGCKYRARIYIRNKLIHLGCYQTIKLAGMAYDMAANKYFKEFAKPNFDSF